MSEQSGEYIKWSPPPVHAEIIQPMVNYKDSLLQIRTILRGVQVVVGNNMIPPSRHEALQKGAIDGLVEHLTNVLDVVENPVEILLQAIGIQRAALARGA